MTTISRSALVMHTPDKMYALVNDVDAYPQFLPWCNAANVLEKSASTQTASIEIAMATVRQQFTTQNTMIEDERIDMALVNGPFSELHGSWVFKPLGDMGCRISLDIEFEFSNVFIAKTVGPVFSKICGSLVDAFCKRADEVYCR